MRPRPDPAGRSFVSDGTRPDAAGCHVYAPRPTPVNAPGRPRPTKDASLPFGPSDRRSGRGLVRARTSGRALLSVPEPSCTFGTLLSYCRCGESSSGHGVPGRDDKKKRRRRGRGARRRLNSIRANLTEEPHTNATHHVNTARPDRKRKIAVNADYSSRSLRPRRSRPPSPARPGQDFSGKNLRLKETGRPDERPPRGVSAL